MTDADSCALPHAKRPCRPCPWRTDTEPGQFSVERYDQLRATSGGPGAGAPLGAPMFACHRSPEGHETACAGWLAAVGREHITVRLAVATGALDAAALSPGRDWPMLFESYEQMAETQGRPADMITP